jgi:hypothetical protein
LSNFNQGSQNIFSSVANQSTNIFQNSSVPHSKLEGAMGQSNSMFSQSNNAGNQGASFLQNFAAKSVNPPVGVNPSLLAARK